MCVTAHIHINLLDLQNAQNLLARVVIRSPQYLAVHVLSISTGSPLNTTLTSK